MQVCPSGAIERGDLVRKRESPIGLALVDMDRCLLALDQECRTVCLEQCPYEAISLNEWTWEDPNRHPIVETAKCPGCGACVAGRSVFLDGGMRLLKLDPRTGKKLAEHHVDALPVFDGMAAAGGRLFLTTTDGNVLCLSESK